MKLNKDKKTESIFKNRLMLLCMLFVFAITAVAARLFNLQIIYGEEYAESIRTTTMRTMEIKAPRGCIYDKWGRVLAENKTVYSLKLDLTASENEDIGKFLPELLDLLESNNEYVVSDFPVVFDDRYEFTFSSENEEMRWKNDMGLTENELEYNAKEVFEYFIEKFNVPDDLIIEEKLKFLSIMSDIYMQRYKKYNSITIAEDIGNSTISYVEEHSDSFPGIYAETQWIRSYPKGEAFSHILGYVGSINEEELNEYEQYGYEANDEIGKIGIEKTCELLLRGTNGRKMIEVDAAGRRVNEENITSAKKGGDVFLTIDANLQQRAFDILENNLKAVLLNKIDRGEISADDIIKSMEKNGVNSVDEINALKNKSISYIREKIQTGEIRVNQINMDPCTGSAVVIDVNTGNVIALVSYPAYDNNQLVKSFNSQYYNLLLKDSTTPLINRPLMERKAPGSVLKMLSAIAGLEMGVFDENTVIYDKGIYKDAGIPYAKCLIYSRYGITHKNVDVRKAIEVSCNYYFYELANRLGNSAEGTTLDSIAVLDEYMAKFGLDSISGIEIEESAPKMASPQLKNQIVKNSYPDADESQIMWTDGDSIRCAIGQSYNSFSAINIAKYIAALSNGGTRYKTSIIMGTRNGGNKKIEYNKAVIEEKLNLSDSAVSAVKEGMRRVVYGSQGTLRNYFRDFPIETAAKTGTAEEASDRPSHSWFAGFAPYDDPQIAVVVMIPFGESNDGPAIKTAKEIIEAYFGTDLSSDNGKMFINELAK